MHQVDAVGNSSRVCRELTEGIRSLPGWRKEVCQKKIESHRKIVGGSRKVCREVWTMQWDLAGSSLGHSPKGSESLLGARREITGRRPDDLLQECRRYRIGRSWS
ncbi:hypothetical protein BHM03_00009832 [Ensete ventricosum]|nr:hypothetical protein BHM03_00009832 [Ensete ventricosum]